MTENLSREVNDCDRGCHPRADLREKELIGARETLPLLRQHARRARCPAVAEAIDVVEMAIGGDARQLTDLPQHRQVRLVADEKRIAREVRPNLLDRRDRLRDRDTVDQPAVLAEVAAVRDDDFLGPARRGGDDGVAHGRARTRLEATIAVAQSPNSTATPRSR
jgi:hypothetical protein